MFRGWFPSKVRSMTASTPLHRLLLLAGLSMTSLAAFAAEAPRGQYRGVSTAVRFDVSPPLRNIALRPPADLGSTFFGALMVDPNAPGKVVGPQDQDRSVQTYLPAFMLAPAPIANFNVGTGTANPPDPVGDVGPNHYVRMANASFQIFNKTGTSLFGPAAINTLFTGFGGACETENAGDPIVVYDQLADRWLLSQFSDSNGPGFFNCVALSTGSDPTGTYYRWAFATDTFPDYPKYGIWPNAYLISTREIDAGLIGAYAVDRQQMLAGNASPRLIEFTVPVNEFSGDGLLPADVDGNAPPPPGAPAYYLGAMDDGGPYSASQDALALWEFDIDFDAPATSSFQVVKTIPVSPYDTIFPCDGRSCIPQPAPLGAVDILSYRQRPTFRAAYRNFGSYQAIVATQSVEAAPNMAGMRWWEVRNPGANAVLYQDSTFAPGVGDGIHRWMGSIAQDRSGNIGLGYSASSGSLFPSVRYTGRLESDALNEMTQGEGVFVNGGGGHTASTRRWGDYTSMNIDPSDDCTFWYINQYFVSSGTQWTLRAGSFKFPDCGQPNLGLSALPLTQSVCASDDISIAVEGHGYDGFNSPVALSVTNVPVGMTSLFSTPTLLTIPGTSTLTLGNAAAVASGTYTVDIHGSSAAPALSRSRSSSFTLFAAEPDAPALVSPAPAATGQPFSPLLSWSASTGAQTYLVEVASDAAFTTIVHTSPSLTGTSYQLPIQLAGATEYFWRVRAANICGSGLDSTVSSFTTRAQPGSCAVGEQLLSNFSDNVESGTNGWTVDPPSGNTWTRSSARPASGSFAWLAVDVITASDQRLISPVIALPAAQNSLTLRFQHDVTMEENTANSCWDGGFVEVSTNGGGVWTPLTSAQLLESPYTGPLPSGQQAWCNTLPYRTASFDLSSYSGQNVQFRFRAITDSSVGRVPHGWYVDDIRVEGCFFDPGAVFRDGFE